MQRANSGLARPLNKPSPSLVQNAAVTPCHNLIGTDPLGPLTGIEASTILLDQHDDNIGDIFAYLRFARSLHQSPPYFPGHGSLSLDQYRAIWALGVCSDDDIRKWLKEARKLRDSEQYPEFQADSVQQPSFAYLSSLGQLRQNLHPPAANAVSNLLHTENPHQRTLIGSAVHPPKALDKIHTSQGATKAANLYWCTICEDRHSYKNISDWRKHEHAHVNAYVCMLTGPVDETEGYRTCSFCGLSNPSEEHLSAHNTHTCGRGIPGAFYCKRRADLVKHLKRCHNIQEKARGEAVANKWKETTKKQAWSCGFCVHLFDNFRERLGHIAKHFECGQTLDEWDTTKVIEGLLQQPGMSQSWSLPSDWRSPENAWKKDAVKRLQHNLELGPSDPKHAAALVQAVYNARHFDLHPHNDGGSFAFAPNHEALGKGALAPTSDHTSFTSRMFDLSSNHEQPQFVDPAEMLQNGFPALDGAPMATDDYRTLPFSFSDQGNSSIKDPLQAFSSESGPSMGNTVDQEQSNATTGMHMWSRPAMFDDDHEGDDMFT